MIRNYNGKANHMVIRDLKRLCAINAEDEQNLFEVFDRNGEVGVYENLDPFTGCPDEMSTVVALKTEEEVRAYLKKHLQKRIEGYLSNKEYEEDYLLTAITAFIAENGRFPYKEEMKQLEKNAEEKRIAELPADSVNVKKEITINDIALEILELAEEIMEARRESNPDDIHRPPEPYPEKLCVKAENFKGNIINYVDYAWTKFHYGCYIEIKGEVYKDTGYRLTIERISIEYCSDGTPIFYALDYRDQKMDKDITAHLITIHKGFVEMAKQAEFDFESEIDYQKFSS